MSVLDSESVPSCADAAVAGRMARAPAVSAVPTMVPNRFDMICRTSFKVFVVHPES
jgi:hypothetical protein